MTEDAPNDLNFGHFGTPAYDLDNSKWAFARTSHGTELQQLGGWKPSVSPAVRFPLSRLPRTLRSAQRATKSIARNFPELVSASAYIPELEAVSAAATAALSTYDATVGQLMSFGFIAPPESRARFTRRVVALPTGEGGNILRLQLLTKERYGWEKDARSLCYLQGLSLNGDSGFWNEDAAAIQQVCFAQTEERGSFLAVRLPQRISLFRPVYHGRPDTPAKSPFYELPPSTVEIYPFHSVWIKDTGKAPHTDVSFNPYYQRQFAIVDQDSSWSVWDIDGNRRAYTVKRTASGILNNTEELDSDEQAETVGSWKEDGWARIMWVGDANTILICNRRRLELVDLKGSTRTLRTPQVIDWSSIKNPSRHWILDIKRHPTNEKEFFVLTSVRLYLLAVTSLSHVPPADPRDADAAIILSWTHFRGMEDITLQLNVQSTSEEETAVFLHSRLNALITVYHLVNQSSTSAPYKSFGPSTLRLENLKNASGSKRILNFDIAQLSFKDMATESRGLGHEYIDRGVQFYQLSAVFDDFSVAQTMLCSLGLDASHQSLSDIEPTSWATIIRPPTHRSQTAVSSDEDDFVEPDGVINTPDPLLKPAYQLPKLLKPMKQKSTHRSRDIYNFSGLYQSLVSNTPSSQDNAKASPEAIDIATLMANVKGRLEGGESVEPFTLGTMQEYAASRVTVDDVDEASTRLQDFQLTEEHASSLELRRIASSHVLGFENGEAQELSSISSVYDLILQNWVAPLPGAIPARIRQSKERMARRIATGVVLASTRVREPEEHFNLAATQSGPSQDSAVALSSSVPKYSSDSEWLSQRSPPSDPDSIVTPPISAASLLNPLARLSKHLHINQPTTAEIPPSINQVLSHWQLGADPSAYNWEANERAFAEKLELEQEGAQKRREKSRRKKERQVKRQKRENQLHTDQVESQPAKLQSSPGPVFAAGSSQAPTQGQPFGGLVMQSQVEPGRHGGRPAKKKKAKSRMSGF